MSYPKKYRRNPENDVSDIVMSNDRSPWNISVPSSFVNFEFVKLSNGQTIITLYYIPTSEKPRNQRKRESFFFFFVFPSFVIFFLSGSTANSAKIYPSVIISHGLTDVNNPRQSSRPMVASLIEPVGSPIDPRHATAHYMPIVRKTIVRDDNNSII